jgi:DNA-binding SARP family transcriptional activator
MSALSVGAEFVVAVLATWLGMLVLTRTPRALPARVFALLTALIAIWGAVRVVGQLTADDGVRRVASGMEAAIAPLLLAAFLHFVLAITARGRWRAAQRIALAVAYGTGILVAILSLANRDHPIAIRPPYRTLGGIAAPVLGWGWIGMRAVILGLAVWWVWRAWQAARRTGMAWEQLTALLAAALCAAVGGLATILLADLGYPEWPGTALIAVSLGLAAYAVFAQGIFLDPGTARRSFSYSLGTGVVTVAYIILLLGLEQVARRILKTETPLLTALAIVLTVALFDPIRARIWLLLNPRAGRREHAHRRLMQSLGDQLLTAQRPRAAIQPALAQLCRTLGARAAVVVDRAGETVAMYGPPLSTERASLALPLAAADRALGTLLIGPKRSSLPYARAEAELFDSAAAFIAASLHLDEREMRQAAALDALTEERAALQAREQALAGALTVAEPPGEASELRVWALGPLRVERNGERIRQWGGAKAGTRQAEGMFAFLFDRAERGVAKDEFVELIWPDMPLDKADLAFHRTLGGLRRTLEPALTRGSEATAIVYHNDRYRLDPALVTWSDLFQFRAHVAASAGADAATAIAALEGAHALYRGDYLDDCPFYGDSAYVEERRALLRGQYVDVLLALAGHYEARGDLPATTTCFREALQVSGNDCPRADAALTRLGVTV